MLLKRLLDFKNPGWIPIIFVEFKNPGWIPIMFVEFKSPGWISKFEFKKNLTCSCQQRSHGKLKAKMSTTPQTWISYRYQNWEGEPPGPKGNARERHGSSACPTYLTALTEHGFYLFFIYFGSVRCSHRYTFPAGCPKSKVGPASKYLRYHSIYICTYAF